MLPKKIGTVFLTFCMMLVGTGSGSAQDGELAVQPLRIQTVLDASDEPFVDVCYELEGFYKEPHCDTDGDGLITIPDVPIGTYKLVQTAEIGNFYPIGEPGVNLWALEIRNEDNNDYRVNLIEAEPTTNLGIITRDPQTGDSIEGACYQLLDYSQIGCDDDSNGIIMFEDIPWGNYTIQQTITPDGYDAIGDYEIALTPNPAPGTGDVILPLIQAESQGSETSINVSVVAVDAETGERVASEKTCIEFPGMTNTGCDDGIVDGQIDFQGVDPTFGQPTFEVASLACGYEQANPDEVEMHKIGEYHTFIVLRLTSIPADCDV